MPAGISLNLSARHSEKRPPDVKSFGEVLLTAPYGGGELRRGRHILDGSLLHTADSAESRPPHKVQNQSLGIVVGIVGDCHGTIAVFLAERREPSVAKFPRGHFNAHLAQSCIADGIEINVMELHAPCLAPVSHKLRISVTFLAAKTEITMSHSEIRNSLPVQHIRKSNGIHSPAYAHH